MRFGKTRMEGKSGVERDGTTRGGVGWGGREVRYPGEKNHVDATWMEHR